MKHVKSLPWSFKWIIEHITSGFLLIFVILISTGMVTFLIISIEELVVFIIKHRLINTYSNVYNNSLETVLWHFCIVLTIIGFWSAIDTFL